jgi:antitoxin component of MazEF toxin-antitoxin module
MKIKKQYIDDETGEHLAVVIPYEEYQHLIGQQPTPKKRRTLATMLNEITEQNIHEEIDTGNPQGKEKL